MLFFVAIATMAFLAASCDGYYRGEDYYISNHYLFSVQNATTDTIVWYVPRHGAEVAASGPCKDAGILPATLDNSELEYFYVVPPRRTYSFYVTNAEPLCPIEEYHPEDSVPFYFFSPATLRDYSWEEIVNGRMWLANYSFKPQDIIDKEKKIRFPQQ